MSSSSVQPHHLLWLRYLLPLKEYGTEVMREVFKLSYKGSHPIMTYLESKYSNKQLKTINGQQRLRLQNSAPDDINKLDITLLYYLLQRVCGFPDSNDSVWKTSPTQGISLEYNLSKIKALRNDVSHEDQQLSQLDLNRKLTELQQLMEDTFQEAYTRFGQTYKLPVKLAEVREYFIGLQVKIKEPMTFRELQQEIEAHRQEIRLLIKETSETELCTKFITLCQVDSALWQNFRIQAKQSVLFIEPTIHEDVVMSGRPSEMQHYRDVKCNELLSFKVCDGSTPNVLLLSGEGGVGKTTLLLYVLEKWSEDPQAMNDLDKIEVVLYMQCRGSTIKTFDELVEDQLPSTYMSSCVSYEFFKEILRTMKILTIIDGFDEYNDDSVKLVKDVIKHAGRNMRVLVTTRPGSAAEQLKALIPLGKRTLCLVLKGISAHLQVKFVDNMINVLVSDVDKRDDIKTNLNAKLSELRLFLGEHLNYPLTLTILIILWVEHPKTVNTSTTSTELYGELWEHLTSNLVERLRARCIVNPERKCRSFLDAYYDLALQSLKRREYELQESSKELMEEKCDKLELRPEDVLSTYFVKKPTRRGLIRAYIWSFLHLRFQEYCAAQSVCMRLLRLPDKALQSTTDSRGIVSDPSHEEQNNAIREILSGESDKCKNVWAPDSSTYQSVLFSITGILTKSGQQLNRYAPDIVQLIHEADQDSFCIDNYLHLVVESNVHRDMVREVATALKCKREWTTSGSYLRGLISVVELVVPEIIDIDLERDPSLYPGLLDALGALSYKKTRVHLQFIDHYLGDSGLSDNLLRAITPGQCSLEEFSGRLSSDALTVLPLTVKNLVLRCNTVDLPSLAATLPSLQKLHDFVLMLMVSGRPSPDSLPVLSMPMKYTRFILKLTCDLADDDATWCCDVVNQLMLNENCYKAFHLHDTHLTSVGVEQLMKNLDQLKIKLYDVVIYSLHNFSEEEKHYLKNLPIYLRGTRLRLNIDIFQKDDHTVYSMWFMSDRRQ